MSKISWDSTHIDVSDDVRSVLTDKMYPVYVPMAAGPLLNAIMTVDTDAVFISAASILQGDTPFDIQKMSEYGQRWVDTNIPSRYADICLAHITQESVDAIAHRVNEEVIVTTVEDDR